MKSNLGPLGPHETRDILQKQIEGKLPIGAAFLHACGKALVQAVPAEVDDCLQLHPNKLGPLIRATL